MLALLEWLSTGCCLCAQLLLARCNRWGWGLDVLGCVGWAVAAVLEGSWPLGVLIVGCGVVDLYGWRRWSKRAVARAEHAGRVRPGEALR